MPRACGPTSVIPSCDWSHVVPIGDSDMSDDSKEVNRVMTGCLCRDRLHAGKISAVTYWTQGNDECLRRLVYIVVVLDLIKGKERSNPRANGVWRESF